MARLRQYVQQGRPRRPAELEPGELVWASIINGLENPNARGKSRPVILVEPRGAAWKTMGLTTNPRYRDGRSRVSIPDPWAVGLRAPGWLWGDRLPWTAGIDIREHIGWVDPALAFQVIKLAGLQGGISKTLLDAAREHHSSAFPPDLRVVQGGSA